MYRKLASLTLALCLIGGLLLPTYTSVHATEDTPQENVEDQNHKMSIEINTPINEAYEGQKGSLDIHLKNDSGVEYDLGNYELQMCSNDGSVLGTTDLQGVEYYNYMSIYTSIAYQIPKKVDGESLTIFVQLINKNDASDVLGQSSTMQIPLFDIEGDVLKYRDPSKGERYKLTVEGDPYLLDWSITDEDVSYVHNDYYLAPHVSYSVFFQLKEGCTIQKVEITSKDAGEITKVDDDYFMEGTYDVQLKAPATVKVTTISAIESKAWQKVVEGYIDNIRQTDWFTGDEINNHFYKETAPAEDIAIYTLREMNVWKNYELNDENNYEIPYDEFIAYAKNYFVHVPSLKDVDIAYAISYDAKKNCMLIPSGGVGNPSLITEFKNVIDLGNGRYALQFNVSKEEWDEEKPDMSCKENYTECTLTVEDNGKGQWRFVSFEKGYTNGTPSAQTPDTDEEIVEDKPTTHVTTDVEKIKNAKEGSSVQLDMGKSTVVSQEILAAAQGKDVKIVLKMNGYTWSIDGKDIQKAQDIDLGVTLDTHAIPSDLIKSVAAHQKTKQLSLAHNGAFGFKAQLQINVGKDYAQQYGNLYWYHDHALELIDVYQVDHQGMLTLTFDHASDYVIVFDKQKHQKTAQSVKTEDTSPILFYVVACVGAGIIGLILLRKKSRQ